MYDLVAILVPFKPTLRQSIQDFMFLVLLICHKTLRPGNFVFFFNSCAYD